MIATSLVLAAIIGAKLGEVFGGDWCFLLPTLTIFVWVIGSGIYRWVKANDREYVMIWTGWFCGLVIVYALLLVFAEDIPNQVFGGILLFYIASGMTLSLYLHYYEVENDDEERLKFFQSLWMVLVKLIGIVLIATFPLLAGYNLL